MTLSLIWCAGEGVRVCVWQGELERRRQQGEARRAEREIEREKKKCIP